MQNPFSSFKLSDIVGAINVIPNNYGRLNSMGLFPVKGSFTDTVMIERKHGVLTLLPTEGRGGPGVVGGSKKRDLRIFNIPQIVYDEHVSPRDVDAARMFGTSNSKEGLNSLLDEKLTDARMKHDITLEFHRMGALKGRVLDADGSVIYDLYDEFGITQKTVQWELSSATFNVRKACTDLARYMEENLLGEVMSGIRVEVSPTFMDALVDHAKVAKVYEGWQAAAEKLGGDVRNGFTFGGLTFYEYAGSATNAEGTVMKFIEPGAAHAYPMGTSSTFKTYAAPADFNETVNKLGRLYYAKVLPAKFGRGFDVHTQSNPLAMCSRPQLLVEIEMT